MISGVISVSITEEGASFSSAQMGNLDINLAVKIRQAEMPTLPPTK